MKAIILFITLFFSSLNIGLSQVNPHFKYQAVARDASGDIMINQSLSIRITIYNEVTQSNEYVETHQVTTNQFGIFYLNIGTGNPTFGTFSRIKFDSSNEFEIRIAMDVNGGTNYKDMGVVDMLFVPYAHHALTVRDKDDADADPQNEIQMLSINGTQLTISGGNTVNLPTGGSGGTNDDDPNNEIQDLSSSKNGNVVDLSISLGGQGTTIDVSDDDNDASNEIQSLQAKRQGDFVDISISGVAAKATFDIRDGDDDHLNEIQSLSINGDQLAISGGNSVTLPSSSNGWAIDGNAGLPNDNFLGTTDATDLNIGTSDESRITVGANGVIGIDGGIEDRIEGRLSTSDANDMTLQAASVLLASQGSGGNLSLNGGFAGSTGANGDVFVNALHDGKIGLGTYYPLTKVHIGGNARVDGFTATDELRGNKLDKLSIFSQGGIRLVLDENDDGANDIFSVGGQKGSLSVEEFGNLLVESSNPNLIGGVQDNNVVARFGRTLFSTGNTAISIDGGATTNSSLYLSHAGEAEWEMESDLNRGQIEFIHWPAINDEQKVMVLNKNRHVGINTDNPEANLHVKGTMEFEVGGVSIEFGETLNGNSQLVEPYIIPEQDRYGTLGTKDFRWWEAHANTYYSNNTSILSYSDERLKENIKDLEPSLNKVMSIKSRRYDLKSSDAKIKTGNNKNQIGFVAQELEKVYPEFVSTNPKDGIKSVAYASLIPVLVKAIQEQQEQIETLTNKCNILESELTASK